MKSTKKNFIATLLILVLTLIQTGCQNKQQAALLADRNAKTEDFDAFYDRFHSDSVFQMTRVKFPLGGGLIEGGSSDDVGDGTPITKDNYQLLKFKIYDVDTAIFKTSYSKSKDSFIEKAWIEDSGFSCEFRFKLIGKKWFLVYAQTTNI